MRRPSPTRRSRVRVEPLEDRSLPSFLAAPEVPVGPSGGDRSEPVAIVEGDFNRDGKLDVATANFRAGGISVLLGTGTGGFKPAINITLGHSPVHLLAVDVNGDNKLDLVTADNDIFATDGTVTVLLGNGLGGFTVAGKFAAGPDPNYVAAGDLNGDGHVDLAVPNFSNGVSTITLLYGTGTGKFNPGGTVPAGDKPESVAIADFNGDGHPDLASVSGGFGHLNINLNNGNGTFAAPVNYATGFCAAKVVAADFNKDGKVDLAVACAGPSHEGVSILLGNGDGTFGTFTDYDEDGQMLVGLTVADLNGDGNLDLVTANGQFATNTVGVLLGNGDGSFGKATLFTANQGPQGVVVGDFNGDGWPDAVTAGTGKSATIGDMGTVATLFGNGDGTLAGSRDWAVGTDTGATAVADFTGDGKPDLAIVVTDVQFNGVTIFPGTGSGTFAPRMRTAAVGGPTGVATADFNGDGKADLAVTTGSGVSVFFGNGDGTFGTPTAYADANRPVWVTAADFNNDGKPDLALADLADTAPGASILLNNGNGTFGAATTVAAGGSAVHLAAADLNGDGKLDLAVVNRQTSGSPGDTLTVLWGTGNGTFTLNKSYPTDHNPDSVGIGDFNGDGRPDLAVSTFFGPGLMIFTNAAGKKFAPAGTYDTDSLPIGVVVTDFNGDKKLDVAVINEFGDTAEFFNGNGLGGFGKPARYPVGDFPMWGSAADFTGDGGLDLAVSNGNSGTFTLLATPAAAAGFRVDVSPESMAGQAVAVRVTAVDALGHLVPSYTGSVKLTSTDGKALLPLPYKYTPTAHGTHKFVVTLKTAGSRNVVASAGTAAGTGSVMVTAAAATHLKVSAPITATAGSPFDLTVQALDRFGNPDPAFNGTVHFTSTDVTPGVTLPADYTFTGTDGGSHTFTGVTLLKAAAKSVSATALGVKWLYPKATAPVAVTAGTVARFLVSGFPTTIGANVSHTFTVTAQDAYGNTVTNYAGTVQFTSSDPAAVLPGPYTFTTLKKGKATFTAKFVTPGTGQSLTVTDQGNSSITGSVTGITVL